MSEPTQPPAPKPQRLPPPKKPAAPKAAAAPSSPAPAAAEKKSGLGSAILGLLGSED